MLIAQRWILARLRDQTFFELGPLNAAIRVLLDELNDRPMKKLGVSRRALYEQLDRPALRPLPATRYVLAHWKPCRVNIDYHVTVEHHVYSVPYQLVHEQVEVRYTTNTVEVFHRDKRVASHRRRYDRQPSTVAEHMPSAHRAHAEWSPSRLIGWANKVGPTTAPHRKLRGVAPVSTRAVVGDEVVRQRAGSNPKLAHVGMARALDARGLREPETVRRWTSASSTLAGARWSGTSRASHRGETGP